MPKYRLDRLDEQIKQCVSQIIANELKDPDLPMMTTVMTAEVSGDLRHCKLRVSFLGTDDEGAKRGMKALRRSAGFIRRRLAQEVQIRYTPELHFELDDSVTYSLRIASILDTIHQEQPEEEDDE